MSERVAVDAAASREPMYRSVRDACMPEWGHCGAICTPFMCVPFAGAAAIAMVQNMMNIHEIAISELGSILVSAHDLGL